MHAHKCIPTHALSLSLCIPPNTHTHTHSLTLTHSNCYGIQVVMVLQVQGVTLVRPVLLELLERQAIPGVLVPLAPQAGPERLVPQAITVCPAILDALV